MLKISKRYRLLIGKVLIITLIYTIINLFLYFLYYAIIKSPYSLGPSPDFDEYNYLYINSLIGITVGLLGGTSLVIVNSRFFRKRSFKFALLTTGVFYVCIFFVAISTSIIYNISDQYGSQGINWTNIVAEWHFIFDNSYLALVNFILWGFITLLRYSCYRSVINLGQVCSSNS